MNPARRAGTVFSRRSNPFWSGAGICRPVRMPVSPPLHGARPRGGQPRPPTSRRGEERRRRPAGAAGRTRTSKPWGSETHPVRTHRTGRTRSGCSPKPGPRRCALSGAPPVSARIALTDSCCLLALPGSHSQNQKSQAGQGVDLLAFSGFRSPSWYLLALLRNRSQARKTRKARQVKGLTCSRCATPQPQSSWRFAHSASTWKHHQTLRRSLLCSPGMCKPRRCHGAAAMRRRKMTDSGRAGEAETKRPPAVKPGRPLEITAFLP